MSEMIDKSDVETRTNIEGETPPVEDDIEEKPYRNKSPRRVQTQPYDYAVRSLMDMIVDGDLILNPDYQRNYRWDDKKASRFVESLILNIPIPVVYLNEEENARLTVIDGQQRLASLLRFIKPEELNPLFKTVQIQPLILKNLSIRSDLNGKSFRDLSYEDKSLLQKRHIRCIVILNESDSTLKFEVFERLNTGSVELSDQEIRNCVHGGTFNQLLLEAARSSQFQELISLPTKWKDNMKDAELVLRFLAYRDLNSDYNENYTEYLNEYMEEHRQISDALRQELFQLFNKTIDLIYDILGPKIAFRKPWDRSNPAEGRWTHTSINGAIYESQMIVYSCLPPVESISLEQKDAIRDATFKVFDDDTYWDAISSGTATRGRVIRRSKILHSNLSEILTMESLQQGFNI